MTIFVALLGSTGLIGLTYILILLGRLSHRLGEVTHMPPYYRGFYIAAILTGFAFFARLVRISTLATAQAEPLWLQHPLFYLYTYYIPLALGLTIGGGLTLLYWSWLLKEWNR